MKCVFCGREVKEREINRSALRTRTGQVYHHKCAIRRVANTQGVMT